MRPLSLLGIFICLTPWFHRVFPTNIPLSLTLLLATLSLQLKNKPLIIISFIILSIFQIKITDLSGIYQPTESDLITADQNLTLYPTLNFQLASHTFSPPISHYFEQNRLLFIANKLKDNLFRPLDINAYFFAYHPLESDQLDIFPKYPYLFLPFFFIGLFIKSTASSRFILLVSAVIPLILLTLIGPQNRFGPFILFPFITLTTFSGITHCFHRLHDLQNH